MKEWGRSWHDHRRGPFWGPPPWQTPKPDAEFEPTDVDEPE